MKHYAHLPPLPKPSAGQTLLRDITARTFAEGCYLLRFQTKKGAKIFDGTLRFDQSGSTLMASADLYKRTTTPNPSNRIPVFPRKAYSNYWRVVEIVPTDNGLMLNFESYLFKSAKGGSWQLEGVFSANMQRQNAPQGFETMEETKVVQKLLTTPDLLLTLVLGGDYVRAGVSALKKALAQPSLRTHFAFLEARRLSQKKKNRIVNLRKAAQLISENPVMSLCEKAKAQQFFDT